MRSSIITTAKRLSVNEQFQQSTMDREVLRGEITQRSIWYSLTKETNQKLSKKRI
ncbi:MAG: hypothetical protein AB9903_31285 [Vulcanimicrobiota bacterium]